METIYEKSLAYENDLAKKIWPEPKTLVFGNSKTGLAFRSLLRYCTHRTDICSLHCYASRGPIAMKNSIVKAISVRRWIEEHGIEKAVEKMGEEINTFIFRFMDRGDFDQVTINLANRLVVFRPDVLFCAFSRNLEALKKLSPKISRIYSVDETSVGTIKRVPKDIKISFLKVDNNILIPPRVRIVFPVNHRKNLVGDSRDCSFYHNKNKKCNNCRRCFLL